MYNIFLITFLAPLVHAIFHLILFKFYFFVFKKIMNNNNNIIYNDFNNIYIVRENNDLYWFIYRNNITGRGV